MSVDNYQEWIQLVAQYTVQSLKAWQWASGSIHYLLGLWSRLVSSAAYLKGDAPSLLDTYAPRIIEAYLSSRCRALRAGLCVVCTSHHLPGLLEPAALCGCGTDTGGCQVLRQLLNLLTCQLQATAGPVQVEHCLCSTAQVTAGAAMAHVARRLESVQLCMSSPGVDDPLDNEEQLADQMDALPYMCRLQYARTQEYLCGIMDPLISAMSERQASGAQLPGS